jgi:hypothetical protein
MEVELNWPFPYPIRIYYPQQSLAGRVHPVYIAPPNDFLKESMAEVYEFCV